MDHGQRSLGRLRDLFGDDLDEPVTAHESRHAVNALEAFCRSNGIKQGIGIVLDHTEGAVIGSGLGDLDQKLLAACMVDIDILLGLRRSFGPVHQPVHELVISDAVLEILIVDPEDLGGIGIDVDHGRLPVLLIHQAVYTDILID